MVPMTKQKFLTDHEMEKNYVGFRRDAMAVIVI